jgi:hypothetical protein
MSEPLTEAAAPTPTRPPPVDSTFPGSAAGGSAPRLAGGYEIGPEIARGGMGVVHRGRDVALNREVAIKLLQAKFPADGPTARRFVEEAQITGQLQHPSIPAVHHVGTLPDGRPFLAMKLIKGQTLDELLKPSGGDEPRRSFLGVFEGICQAVGYAHAHGVVHRDLKPANVMVGSFGEVQVMDWGLAKVLTSGGVDPRRSAPDDDATLGTEIKSLREADDATHAGSVLGTPAFMPPEQAIGAVDEIDARSDVFGLGGLLCVMLTGRPPYQSDTAESTRKLAARAKLDEAFAALDSAAAEPDLIALCKRCLSAEKADRPADGNAVATEVAKLRAAADERARRAEVERERTAVKAVEERKRQRMRSRLSVITLLMLLIGVIGTSGGLFRAATEVKARVEGEAAAKAMVRVESDAAKTARARTGEVLTAMTSSGMWDSATKQKVHTPEQARFLAKVLSYCQETAVENGQDVQLRNQMADAAFRVGCIQFRLARNSEAAVAFRQAATEYERLTIDSPNWSDYRLY